MLDVSEVMPDIYKKRKVSAIRDFPKGCGRYAPPLDVKPIQGVPPHTPPPPPPAEPEPGKLSTSETPIVNGTAELQTEKASKPMPAESLPPESLKPETVGFSSQDHDVIGAIGSSKRALVPDNIKEEVEEANDSVLVVKSERKELSKRCLGLPELLDSSSKDDGFDGCGSKLYGPAKRRKVSAIRNFPLGCGRNAIPMSREECLRVTAASKNKILVPEKESTGEKKSAAGDTGRVQGIDKIELKLQTDGAEQVQETVEEIGEEGQAKSVSRSELNGIIIEEDKGKKVLARVVQEGAQENGEFVVASPALQSNLNETVAEEKDEQKVLPFVTAESSQEGAQEIDGVDLVVSKSVLKGNYTEHVQKKVPARIVSGSKLEGDDTKQVNKELQIREAQERRPPRFDAKPKSQFKSKAVEKEAMGSVGKSVEMKRGRDIKSQKWKLLEVKEENDALILQPRGGLSMSNEVSEDRLIVQALMAAQNCPWTQGKRSGVAIRHAAMSGEKAKKEWRTPDKKLASLGISASQHRNKAAVGDKEDSLPQDGEDEDALAIYQESRELSVSVTPFGPSSLNHKGGDSEEAVTRSKVRKALRLFQVICRKLLQEEESRSKELGRGIRVDLKAANILKQKNLWVNTTSKLMGTVPGVEVGDEFHYRVELSVIGLHRPFQAGIDCLKVRGTILASSIVATVGHADDMDSSDVLIYAGSGGSAAEGDKPPEDQKLERGNLGLKNSIEAKTPVRVIRGIKELKCTDSQDAKAKPFSTFTYDGLYLVENYWQEEGSLGFFIYKFQLRRIPGQPEIALKEVKKSKKSAVREGLCVIDISEGKELFPISAVNTIDDDRPMHFKYVTEMIYPTSYAPTPPRGCDCTDGCSDSEKCACAVKNGGEIPFNFNGAIVQAKPLVYECGPSCKCPPSCHNRVSQHGIKIQLEIFKTKSMGWGVRSLTSIPSGSFVCEYIGELLHDKEAEQRSNDEYLFDIGHNYDDHSLWEGLPSLIPDLQSSALCEVVEDMGFTIDAAEYGNVGRFINHSCSPNLYAQNVLYDHDDRRMPHIMFFAAENIPPLQELTYHYNYTIDQVRDSEGNVKKKDCHCGSHECTGRLY